MPSITPETCRAARALLQMGQRELAAKANVSSQTIATFEVGKRQPFGRTLDDIREGIADTFKIAIPMLIA